MSNPFKVIGHFFKHIAVWVGKGFAKIFGSDIAHAFAVGAEGLLHSALGQIAWIAVNEVAGLATGLEKKEAAFAKIAEEAKSRGIAVKDSLINMLIEVAVQKLKGEFGPDTSTVQP